jgi:hypothetical protein
VKKDEDRKMKQSRVISFLVKTADIRRKITPEGAFFMPKINKKRSLYTKESAGRQ